MTISSAKRKLTIEIRLYTEYLNNVESQISNQHPQPNGDIYYLGEVIAKKFPSGNVYRMEKVQAYKRELTEMIAKRKAMDTV